MEVTSRIANIPTSEGTLHWANKEKTTLLLAEQNFIVKLVDLRAKEEINANYLEDDNIRVQTFVSEDPEESYALLLNDSTKAMKIKISDFENVEREWNLNERIVSCFPIGSEGHHWLGFDKEARWKVLDVRGEELVSKASDCKLTEGNASVCASLLVSRSEGESQETVVLGHFLDNKELMFMEVSVDAKGPIDVSAKVLGRVKLDLRDSDLQNAEYKINFAVCDAENCFFKVASNQILGFNTKNILQKLRSSDANSVFEFSNKEDFVLVDSPKKLVEIALVLPISEKLVLVQLVDNSSFLMNKRDLKYSEHGTKEVREPLLTAIQKDSSFYLLEKDNDLLECRCLEKGAKKETGQAQSFNHVTEKVSNLTKNDQMQVSKKARKVNIQMSESEDDFQDIDKILEEQDQDKGIEDEQEMPGPIDIDIQAEKEQKVVNESPKKIKEEEPQPEPMKTEKPSEPVQPKNAMEKLREKKQNTQSMKIDLEDEEDVGFVVNEENIEDLDKRKEAKRQRNTFLDDMVKEIKKLPQHFLGKQVKSTSGKIIQKINLFGSIQTFLPGDSSAEFIEVIPNEISGHRKKLVIKNVFKFVCGDIHDKGYVLASSGNETNLDDYEMSEDEELTSEAQNLKSKGDLDFYRNYRLEAKEDKSRGEFLDSQKETPRQKNLKLLRAKKHLKSEFFRKENRGLAKIHFKSFETGSGFNRVLPAGEHVIDVSVSDRLVHVLSNMFLRSYSLSGNLFSLLSLNYCPLGLISTESFVGVTYRYGMPVQGSQNLKLNIYEIYQGRLLLTTDIAITPESELEFIGFDDRGLVYVKDSCERVHVLTEKDMWMPVFQMEPDDDEVVDSQITPEFEEGTFSRLL